MGRGISIPVRPNLAGGVQTEDDPAHLKTILRNALQPGEDDNPFQDLGLDEGIIFAINDPSAQGLARKSVQAILGKFKDRLSLDPAIPIQIINDDEGELRLFSRYVDLDTNEVFDFDESFT